MIISFVFYKHDSGFRGMFSITELFYFPIDDTDHCSEIFWNMLVPKLEYKNPCDSSLFLRQITLLKLERWKKRIFV